MAIEIILIILLISLIPSLLYLVLLPKFKRRWPRRPRYIRPMTFERRRRGSTCPPDDDEWEQVEEVHSYFIGNLSCRYNARSPYIRCAVNPSGPCDDCPHYESKH
ncbi:MAG: DUF6464 family protein [Prochloraceae cyanobacterium]|nr:DUF6464 family protein [Prochloraceae cyanobacterium]